MRPASCRCEAETRYLTPRLGRSSHCRPAHHGADFRYVHIWGRWPCWNSTRRERDETAEVICRSKAVVKPIYTEAADAFSKEARQALANHAMKSEPEGRIKSMVALAQAELEVSMTRAKLDTAPMLLNVANDTADLATSKLRDHRRSDYITRCIPIEYPVLKEILPPGSFPTSGEAHPRRRKLQQVNRHLVPNSHETSNELYSAALTEQTRFSAVSLFWHCPGKAPAVLDDSLFEQRKNNSAVVLVENANDVTE